jgi:hypothetical protein
MVKAEFAESRFFSRLCLRLHQSVSQKLSGWKRIIIIPQKISAVFLTAKSFARLTAGSSRDFSKSCNITFQSFVLQ